MALSLPVYLDNHSTTRVDPRVVETMLPYFNENFGNAASKHHEFGWRADAAVGHARAAVARLIGADSGEIFFTSGATESINLALKGVAEGLGSSGDQIITAATEHEAVLDSCRTLERAGFTITVLPVDAAGRVDPDDVKRSMTPRTILVTIMMANNEIGTITSMAEIGAHCREAGVLFHSDATQAVGKVPVSVADANLDLMSFSAHKMYGPKGVGALFVRSTHPKIRITSQMDGGGHERGLRSGTLNVPGIAGFGMAAELARQEMAGESIRLASLRDVLEEGIVSQLGDVTVNGDRKSRLPHNANMTFPGVKADRLIIGMKDIAVSTGSACSSAAQEPSHVLRAIGRTGEEVLSSVRFGLGRFTTAEEIQFTINRVVQTVQTVRARTLQPAHLST